MVRQPNYFLYQAWRSSEAKIGTVNELASLSNCELIKQPSIILG
jgi:hypothetical protein